MENEKKNEIVGSGNQGGFQVIQNSEGKYERKPIYQPFSSVQAETKEQKINLMNIIDGEQGIPMNEAVDEQFQMVDVIFKPYDQIDENTGEITYGVLTYIFDEQERVFVTSSKSVYHSVKNIFTVFGEPHYVEEERLTLQVVKKQGFNNKYIDIKVIG